MKTIHSCLLVALCLLVSKTALKAQDISQIGSQKPFTINGTVGIGLGTYQAGGIEPREHQFSYLFNGAPVFSIYGVTFPFSVVISDQQRGFRQPFNQYGISPQYKWLTIHAGWQSISWSQFGLAGYNFLGGGFEANPGKLRLGFIYGRFNKAISETSTEPLNFQTATYKRTGYAARAGYGTERNHLDVTFLHAKDDAASLPANLLSATLQPAENIVLGINSRWSLFKHLVWDTEISGSLYTRNQFADTLGTLQLGKASFIRDLIAINTSSQLLTAGQTSLNYTQANYNIGVQYRRVDPDYKSMGAYYFETDVENYTVQGGLSLLKHQLRLTGSLGFQHDNLLHDKPYQSKRSISSLSATYNKAEYGVDFRYSNYGITQDRGLNPVIDTFRVARTNYNMSALLRYSINGTVTSHTFLLVGNLQSLSDLNRFTSSQSASNSKTANLTYQLGFNKTGMGLLGTLNYTVADFYLMHTQLFGPTIGLNQQFDKGKIGLNAAVSFQQQHNNNIYAGSVMNGSINGNFRFTKRDAAGLTGIYLKSNTKDASLPSFHEFRTSFNLTHTF